MHTGAVTCVLFSFSIDGGNKKKIIQFVSFTIFFSLASCSRLIILRSPCEVVAFIFYV